jgi:hypothetical protein
MANTQSLPTYSAARLLAMAALYEAGSIALKAALYLSSATINGSTTAYTATGEVSGTNYTAGGVSLTTFAACQASGSVTYTTPGSSIVYTTVTLNAAAFNCVMIYDDANSDRNLYVGTFGDQTITANTLTLNMPTNNSTDALIRWTWS